MQLLEGGKLSTISSGKAHSPTMFCKNNNETNKTEIFLKVEFKYVGNMKIESKYKL